MLRVEILDRAAAGFAVALAQVTPDQWGQPTGNEGWSVRHLVDHVVGGNRMAVAIMAGGSREDGLAQFARSSDDVEVVAAFDESRRELAEAFAPAGALDRIVAHPAMAMPGRQLLGFRITEYALHGWDLATTIGADDHIDHDVLLALLALLEPMADILPTTGMFGSGPSGTLPPDASLQHRVLDLSGRSIG
jgi:uncharacterized protein (TIGR03086 family)